MKKFLLFILIIFLAYITAFYTTGKKNGYDELFDMNKIVQKLNDIGNNNYEDQGLFISDDYIQNGLNYLDKEMYEEALDEFFNAVYEDENSENNYYVGHTYLLWEDYISAVDYLNTSIDLDPKNAKAYCDRGLAKYYQSIYDEAIEDLFFSTELDPENAEAYYNLSLCYESQGNNEVALQSAETAIQYDSLYIDAWFKAGYIAYELEEYQKSADYYKSLLVIDPDHKFGGINLGLSYAYMEKNDSAIYFYNKVIEKYPDYALAYNNKAYIYQKLENYSEAIKWYDLAIINDKNDTRPLWNRGDCYYKLGNYEKAIADFQEVYNLNSDYYNTLYYIGECYEKLNNPEQAVIYFNKYKDVANSESEFYTEIDKKLKKYN